MVLLASVALAGVAGGMSRRFAWLQGEGGLIGTAVSVTFLLAIALLNLVTLRATYGALRRLRVGNTAEGVSLIELSAAAGPLGRLLSPVFRLISRSAHMYPIGLLFGLGFDTASEIAVLGLSATQAAEGLNPGLILLFPVLFAAGMSLIDTLDGALMVKVYGHAFARPVTRLYYNMTMTALSVVIAVVIGMVEAAALIAERLRLSGWPWDWVAALNGNFAALGYLIIGIFAFGWLVSAVVCRAGLSARSGLWARGSASGGASAYTHKPP